MRKKLGLKVLKETDAKLIKNLLELMHKEKADYTNTFRALGDFSSETGSNTKFDSGAYGEWAVLYRARLKEEGSVDPERKKFMDSVNPKFVLRNFPCRKSYPKG